MHVVRCVRKTGLRQKSISIFVRQRGSKHALHEHSKTEVQDRIHKKKNKEKN